MLVAASATTALAGPEADPAQALADRIDGILDTVLARDGIVAAQSADDAEFLRRLTLDLNGRIPTVAEVRAFLDDSDPQKRRRAIDSRLAEPRYVRHFTNVWRAALLAQANPQDVRYLAPKIETWLARQLRDNVPYDQWVRAVVTAPLDSRLDRPDDDVSAYAVAFFQANELKPENLAAATARVFLGVNLDCAQCHNHPFADWKQQQFWQFAAFYAGVGRLRPDNAMLPAPEAIERRELAVADTGKSAQAMFLDGSAPTWTLQSRPREALAEWLTSAENRYFARAAANRLWAHMFGCGIVEPLDALGGRDAPSHPELLDLLPAGNARLKQDRHHARRRIVQRCPDRLAAGHVECRQPHRRRADRNVQPVPLDQRRRGGPEHHDRRVGLGQHVLLPEQLARVGLKAGQNAGDAEGVHFA
jgi:hypothetical protein